MKKVLFALMLILASSLTFVSCTNDNEDEIEFLATDKDKDEPIGGDHEDDPST